MANSWYLILDIDISNLPIWLVTLISGITLTGIWEGVKFFLPDVKHFFKSYQDAKKELYTSIDPILKSADELYGKIYSLSKEDFATFINPSNSISENVQQNQKYVCYLFAQFWAQLEILRMKSQYSSIVRIKKGAQLIKFIEAFEARDFNILDRSIQRMIGEGLIENAQSSFQLMSLNQFIISLGTPRPENVWIKELETKLFSTKQVAIRQRFLMYGFLLDALIKHYDPKNKIVRERKLYINKFNKNSKKAIKWKVFKQFLPFVTNRPAFN